ncbi:MAG: hypothetical protein QM662_08585 [Gordonia sp. (in: high G+C Gram-positive bacteria)]
MTAAPFQHPPCDELIPHALSIVAAVRDDDPGRLMEEIVDAGHCLEAVTGSSKLLAATLIIVLAALVPTDRPVSRLTEWMAP